MMYLTKVYTGDALIGRARSIACTEFLEKPMSPYMLFIDDDIAFKPGDIEKIYQELVHGKHLVGGCYPVKQAGQLASWGNVKLDGTVQPCEYIATGFMGISHDLLKEVVKDLPLLHPEL